MHAQQHHITVITPKPTPGYKTITLEEQVGKNENDKHEAGADLDRDSLGGGRLHSGGGLGRGAALGRRAAALPETDDVGARSLGELSTETVVLSEEGLELLLVRGANVERLLEGNVGRGRGVRSGNVGSRKGRDARLGVTLRVRLGTVASSARSGKRSKTGGTAGSGSSETSRGSVDTANAGGGRGKVLVAIQLGAGGGSRRGLGGRVNGLRYS